MSRSRVTPTENKASVEMPPPPTAPKDTPAKQVKQPTLLDLAEQLYNKRMANPISMEQDHIWEIIENHFDADNRALIEHQLDSYEEFIERGIQKVIDEESEITVIPEKGKKYTVTFGQVYVPSACKINDKRKVVPILPHEARMRDMTYESPIQVDITETTRDNEGNIIGEPVLNRRVNIAHIPVMLASSRCNLRKLTKKERMEQGECARDPGGYFIVNGKERVLVAQIRNAHNEIIVSTPRKANLAAKFKLSAEPRSMSVETGHSVPIQVLLGIDDRTVVFLFPNIGIVNVGIIFKALGYTKEEDILELIGLNTSAEQMKKAEEILSYILNDSFQVKTEEEALELISRNIPDSTAKPDAKKEITKKSKVAYTREIVNTKLLPHLGITATTREKALFLANMVKKLLCTYLGFRQEDDIDNYSNKRFENAGILFTELFRNLFKQYLKTLTTQLQRRPRVMDHTDRLTRITTNIRHSMATGNWGAQKNNYIRSGVSQLRTALSYASSISHLRRAAIPIGKESKSTKQRQIHMSQFGYVCPADTPEGKSVGIVLNFALLTRITRRIPNHIVKDVIRLNENFIPIEDSDIKLDEINLYAKIFLNGAIIGYTDDPDQFVLEIKD